MTIRDVIIQQRQNDKNSFEQSVSVVKARTAAVDFTNSPNVAGRDGYIWIKEFDMVGGYAQVFNAGVPNIINLPVLVYQHPKQPYIRQARDVDFSEYKDYTWTSTPVGSTGPHHATHEWPDWAPGPDIVNVFTRALVPLRAYPSASLSVYVDRYRYTNSYKFIEFIGASIDLTAYTVGSFMITSFILIYLDLDTGTLMAVSNDVTSSLITGSHVGYWPDVPPNAVPSCIIMHTNQTSVTEQMMTDVRDMYGSMQQSGIDYMVDMLALVHAELSQDTAAVALQAGPVERMKFTSSDSTTVFAGVWTTLYWNNSLITIVQDSDYGLYSLLGYYPIQRGGDYRVTVTMDMDPTTTVGVVSEKCVISLDVAVNGVRVAEPIHVTIDVSMETASLQIDTYLPYLTRFDSINLQMHMVSALNANINALYTYSVAVVGVDHNGGV